MKTTITLFVLLTSIQLYSQCNIDPYIQTNYEKDGYILALREIFSDPLDPDYDNPFIPSSRTVPYLEGISAIYSNLNNDPEIDLIFNDLNLHAIQEYKSQYQGINYQIDFKLINFRVNTSDSWVSDFKTTGISGIAALDNLMSTYQFSINSFQDFTTCSCTYFEIETSNNYMNLKALEDDFLAITEITAVETNFPSISLFRFNYTGIPYTVEEDTGGGIESAPAQVANIIVNGSDYIFGVYGSDCFSGCTVEENRTFSIDVNCNVLSSEQFEISKIEMYPNPATTILNFSSNNISDRIDIVMYDATGKQILKSTALNALDVSSLNPGIYFVKITQAERTVTKKLVIK